MHHDVKINKVNDKISNHISVVNIDPSGNLNLSYTIQPTESLYGYIMNINDVMLINTKVYTQYQECMRIFFTKNDYFTNVDFNNINNLVAIFGNNVTEHEIIYGQDDNKLYYVIENSCNLPIVVNLTIDYYYVIVLLKKDYDEFMINFDNLFNNYINLWDMYNNLSNRYNDLEILYNNVYIQLSILHKDYELLEKQKISLEILYNSTNNKLSELNKKFELLTEQKIILEIMYNSTKNKLSELNKKFESLTEQNAELKIKYNELEENYNSLNNSHNEISKDFENSLRKINNLWAVNIIMIIFSILLLIFLSSSIIFLIYTKRSKNKLDQIEREMNNSVNIRKPEILN